MPAASDIARKIGGKAGAFILFARNMKKMLQFGAIPEREAVEFAKQHLEKKGHQFVSVRQCTRKRALKWFGPGVWTLFIEVEDEKEFGVTFMENNPNDIYCHEILSN